MQSRKTWLTLGNALLAGAILAGCSSTSLDRAPVEDRSRPAQGAAEPAVVSQPGYYTVRPGDTLIRIGLEHGQSWKDIAAWNKLENADVIEVGQVLRVVPPGGAAAVASSSGSAAVAQPVSTAQVRPVGAGSAAPVAAPASTPVATVDAGAGNGANTSGIDFIWPASGPLLGGFNEATNKGYDIGGNVGDPVVAAAAGRVVYAGAGLRGYGNLIILKHNEQYLTAYAHNSKLLVKEDQNVTKGQKIAELGNTDADRAKLHFEVRRQGKPVNPGNYLPRR